MNTRPEDTTALDQFALIEQALALIERAKGVDLPPEHYDRLVAHILSQCGVYPGDRQLLPPRPREPDAPAALPHAHAPNGERVEPVPQKRAYTPRDPASVTTVAGIVGELMAANNLPGVTARQVRGHPDVEGWSEGKVYSALLRAVEQGMLVAHDAPNPDFREDEQRFGVFPKRRTYTVAPPMKRK